MKRKNGLKRRSHFGEINNEKKMDNLIKGLIREISNRDDEDSEILVVLHAAGVIDL